MATTDLTVAPTDLVRAYSRLLASGALAGVPEALVDRIVDESPQAGSPPAHFVNLAKLIYANWAKLPVEARRFGAQCAHLCGRYHFMAEAEAFAIQQALQRDAGDDPPASGAWPEPEQDPVIEPEWDVDYVPPPTAVRPARPDPSDAA